MVPFMFLEPLFPVLLMIGYLVCLSSHLSYFLPTKWSSNSLTVNSSRLPCQDGITQTYFPSDFFFWRNVWHCCVFVSMALALLAPNWLASRDLTYSHLRHLTLTWKSRLKNRFFTVSKICSERTNTMISILNFLSSLMSMFPNVLWNFPLELFQIDQI